MTTPKRRGDPTSEAERASTRTKPRAKQNDSRHAGAKRETSADPGGPKKRLNTPLVLAAASAMLCAGIIALASAPPPEEITNEPLPDNAVLVDRTTAERVAESYLDAWRKREHAVASSISRGAALAAVQARAAEDEAMSPHERELKRQVWDAMARTRLRLMLDEATNLEGGAVELVGTAEGEFIGEPYVRQVRFVCAPTAEDEWIVEQAEFGDILTPTPRILHLPDE